MNDCPHRRIRPLGEGAVGDVHLCVDLLGRRLVVVKWLRSDVTARSEAAQRFVREGELMANREWPGVVKVEQFGSDEYGRTWIAMEFIDGKSPAEVIRPGDAWSVHRLLDGVGRSLDELHGFGILHRDLKPENLLLRNASASSGWEPVIIDLGIAKWLAQEDATRTGSVFGTPYYMSPEQFRDAKHVGPATDRYALAVIAYELLSGKLPFDASSVPALLMQHSHVDVPPLHVPEYDAATGRVATLREAPRLDLFMRTALAKRPEARFSSSAEMIEVFAHAARLDGLWHDRATTDSVMPALESPRIELHRPDGTSECFDLREGPVVMGRHEGCPFVLVSSCLSRMHATIYAQGGSIWIADLQSQNGTAFAGRPLIAGVPLPIRLHPGEGAPLRLYNVDLWLRRLPDGP